MNDLRNRIVAAIAKADQDWCSDNNLHEDMAVAVIDLLIDMALAGELGELLKRSVSQWQT